MCTYWLRGFADGSKWNKEYNGKKLIDNSTYEYYRKHGLPTIDSKNGTKDQYKNTVPVVRSSDNGIVTSKSDQLNESKTQGKYNGKMAPEELIPVKKTCDVKDSASCTLL